jgi:hypothetical protein
LLGLAIEDRSGHCGCGSDVIVFLSQNQTQPWPNRWGFFLAYRIFLLDLIKSAPKVCVAP